MNVIEKHNNLLSNSLKDNEVFCCCRPGWGGDSMVPFVIKVKNMIPSHALFRALTNNAGIFFSTENIDEMTDEDKQALNIYCDLYNKCYEISKYTVVFNNCNFLKELYRHILTNYNSTLLKTDIIRDIDMDNSWIQSLRDKSVCIISPFTDTIKEQYKKRNILFKNKQLLPEMNLSFIKVPLTLAGNKQGKNWLGVYKELCNKIDKQCFDVALLSCGGYGHPLCYYIYNNKKRTCIYVGGILQLYFGILGKRWEQSEFTKKYKTDHWVYPSKDETPNNRHNVEKGCYW